MARKKKVTILQEFISMDEAVLKYTTQEAIIKNQKLILETMLEIRDMLCRRPRKLKRVD